MPLPISWLLSPNRLLQLRSIAINVSFSGWSAHPQQQRVRDGESPQRRVVLKMQKMGVGSSTWRLLIVSQNPLEWLSSKQSKAQMAKRVSVQRLWYQNSIWLVFEKATMKCTLDNFMMTCRILGCFYLFIVVIVTYTTAVILPSNMTTVQVICWIFNQLRKTLPIVKIVYLIVYDIQAWNKFVDRYILIANSIKKWPSW